MFKYLLAIITFVLERRHDTDDGDGDNNKEKTD